MRNVAFICQKSNEKLVQPPIPGKGSVQTPYPLPHIMEPGGCAQPPPIARRGLWNREGVRSHHL